jgi:hypothetical protein
MTTKNLGAIKSRLIGRVMEVVDGVHDAGDLSDAGRLTIRGRVVSAVHQAGDDIASLEMRHEFESDAHQGNAPSTE